MHRINNCLLNSVIGFRNTYPLDKDFFELEYRYVKWPWWLPVSCRLLSGGASRLGRRFYAVSLVFEKLIVWYFGFVFNCL